MMDKTASRRIGLRLALWLAVAAALAIVFGLYLDPDFMLTMADQVWACF